MRSRLHTPVCDLLGCTYPILLAGMGGPARSALVAAVTNAGGFGFLGMVRESPQLISEEIAKVRAQTDRDFGVNLIPAATKPDLLEAEIAACLAARVPVMALFWDLSAPIVKRLRDAGVLVVCQVGSAREAEEAQEAGAQVLIAQGVEAGGHVRGTIPLNQLLPQVLALADVPVIACGGIVDGKTVASVMAQGAQGAMLGTAFLATDESFSHPYHKQRIVEAKPGTTIHTDAFHVNWPRGAFVRVLPNSVTAGEHGDPFAGNKQAIGNEGARTIWLFSTDSPLQSMTGDFEAMALYAGQGSGDITNIVPARQRMEEIVRAAEAALPNTPSTPKAADETSSASPTCYAKEADDSYMGYASRDELLAFLNELLEAERAGARVTARTSSDASDPAIKTLMREIYHDEAHWCAMLLRWIANLDGAASPKVGAFYEKCMVISDLRERMAFLNRGQGWVARKLREMLPKTRDDALHADFADMLKSHEENIARANAALN
ncbi:MAG TPA: nitronate monooxygenase [Rhizomicrobium sp.]|nr:nitronate monooxygenase [Rhizomicrobium sp.]